MIGTIIGLVLSFYYIAAAFTEQYHLIWGLYGYILLATIIGVILLPRTAAISILYLTIASLVAAVWGGLHTGNWGVVFISLGLGTIGLICNAIIVSLRGWSFPPRY